MNKKLMNISFFKELSEIDISEIIDEKKTIIGLDIGDKTIGVSVSDRRIKIASAVTVILRKKINIDCAKLYESIIPYNPKIIIFGWPLHMDGTPSKQCEKNLEFIDKFGDYINSNYISNVNYINNIKNINNNTNNDNHNHDERNHLKNAIFAKWDERFSTKVVDEIMIEADLSRKRRKQVIDKTAAAYILQGALDFLNRTKVF
ncbi:MAG: Holliday junction resolvase RuvX [Alphaproteobacteria bacterium]|nr:Holliday junction resolvase RuvX [Alphaproteobacteria bacterium]